MGHILRYLGRFEKNYRTLKPDAQCYTSPEGRSVPLSPCLDAPWGVRFYMMDDMTKGMARPLLVMIENVKLETPLAIDYARHTGTGSRVGPSGKRLSTEFGENLLKDAIEANPGLKTRLMATAGKKMRIARRGSFPL